MQARKSKKPSNKQVPKKWINKDVTQAVLAAVTPLFNLPKSYAELVNLTCDPEAFYYPESFRRAYWRAEMFSKFPFPIKGVDRTANARVAFAEAEQRCATTNARLHDVFNRASTPDRIRQILLGAKRRLAVLFDGFTVDEIAECAQWGPGSSTSLPARFAAPQNKWVFGNHLTESCIPYLDAFVGWSGWLPISEPTIVKGNVVTFVPKNAKTNRSIAMEPDWNMFFQLGLGGAIRRRLQRFGILRPIAQKVNNLLAKKGSQDGFLATVDLKAASDTISLALVEALLPPDVLLHVLNLRSQYGTLDKGKTWFPYEKVSSMGNGFTFELETALFWAISSEVAGHAMVYGDDIIIPSASVALFITVCEYCGFQVNEKKSHFGSSKFRESCGGHYFDGVDVTPIYVREPLKSVSRLAFANRVRSFMVQQRMYEFSLVWKAAAIGIPRIFMGPPSVDGALHVELDEASPRWCKRYQCWEGLRVLRKYRAIQSLQLGGLRQSLFGTRAQRTSYQREPGVARDVVVKWRHDEWGRDHSTPASLAA